MIFLDIITNILHPKSIIEHGGLMLLLFIVFAETGIMIGFFLPGDYLIFIAGLFCATKPEWLWGVSILTLITSMTVAAILGNLVGYWFGYKVGPSLFKREDSFIFKKKYLVNTKDFYDRNGGKTLVLGRFLPVIRTFAPILAGVIKLDFKLFLLYNFIGAALWIGGIASIGYFLGVKFPWIENYLEYIIVGLIIITAIPVIRTYQKEKKISKQ